MKSIIMLFILALFLSSQAGAWTVEADFEKATVGQLADGDSAFSTSRDNTFISSDFARNGKKSAKASIDAGAESGMGGTFFFGATPKQGDELWMRCGILFPSGFDFEVGGAGLKLFRVQTTNGYFNLLMREDGLNVNSPAGTLFVENNPVRSNLGPGIMRNKWHVFETYLKLDTDKGIWRIWQDGNLVFEDTQTFTLKYPDTVGERALVFTYWNGGAPKSQSAYIDDCIVTSDRPTNKDSYGNPYIGVGSFEAIAPPNPPTIY